MSYSDEEINTSSRPIVTTNHSSRVSQPSIVFLGALGLGAISLGFIPLAQFATLLAIGLPFWYSRENKQFIRVGLLYFIHIGALAIFVGLRSYADETARPVIVEAPITFDLWLGNGQLPTHMLQQWLYSEGDVAWYDQLMAVLYAGHFFVIWLAALFLWAKDEVRFSAFMLSNVLCYFISLAVHFAYPTAPPWLASQNEVIENVSRICPESW